VLAADALAASKQRTYAAATAWGALPVGAKGVLASAVGLMVLSCYAVQLLPCFEPYELTSRIEDLPGA
jgi:hypothetical protein